MDPYKVSSFNHKGCAILDQFGSLLLQPAYFCGRQIAYLEGDYLTESVRRIRCSDILYGLGLVLSCATIGWIGFSCRVLASLDKKHCVMTLSGSPSINDSYDPANDTFRALNWNVAAMPALCTRWNGNRPVEERMEEVVEFINTYPERIHTIALEEVFTDEAIQILVERLKTEFPYSVHHCGKNILGLSGGILFLSRFPIVDAEYRSFSNRAGTNYFSQKGCLAVVVDFGNETKGLAMVTHLEAGGGGIAKHAAPSRTKTKDRKMAQLQELESLHETMRIKHQPNVSWLAGDLNLQWKKVKSAATYLDNYHWTDTNNPGISQVAKDARNGMNLGVPKEGNISRVDYIMPRKGYSISPESHDIQETVNLTTQTTSDHFPLIATWNPKAIAL